MHLRILNLLILITTVSCQYSEDYDDDDDFPYNVYNQTEYRHIPRQISQNNNSKCGYRNVFGLDSRISSGDDTDTKFGEFPYMIAVLMKHQLLDKTLYVYQCGGSLVTPTIVMTAAHCVYEKSPQSMIIRAGEWDTQNKNEILPHQDVNISEFIIHEEYKKGSLFNDIALLILVRDVKLHDHINTICLPPQDYNFVGSRCYALGWGKDNFGSDGRYQVILKQVELPIVPKQQCEQNLRTTKLGKFFQLHDSFLCAGGEYGRDTCKGDGGSPLLCPIAGVNNRYYQAGIVSWGIGCNNNIPGVYVNVAGFRNWIEQQLNRRRVNTSYFKM